MLEKLGFKEKPEGEERGHLADEARQSVQTQKKAHRKSGRMKNRIKCLGREKGVRNDFF